MIRVYLNKTNMSAGEVFMFNSLYDVSELDRCRAFCVASSYNDVFDFARAIGEDVEILIRYNSKDFDFAHAPEFYGVIVRD